MRGVFVLFFGVFLQLLGSIALHFNQNFFGITSSVIGVTLFLIAITQSQIKQRIIIYFSLTSTIYLLIIVSNTIIQATKIPYLLFTALFFINLLLVLFSKVKRKIKVKKIIMTPEKKVLTLKSGKIYHDENCSLIQRSKKANLNIYKTASLAKSKGFKPCKMCLP